MFAHGVQHDRKKLGTAADARGRLARGAEPLDPELARRGGQVLRLACADLLREARRALTDEHDVRAALHHCARDADRMEVALKRGDRAGAMRRAIDDRRVELDLPEDVRPTATADARVRRVRLDHLRAGLDRVEGRAAAREDADPDRQPGRAIAARDDDRNGHQRPVRPRTTRKPTPRRSSPAKDRAAKTLTCSVRGGSPSSASPAGTTTTSGSTTPVPYRTVAQRAFRTGRALPRSG